ncbi:hypothetical protein Tco_0738343 [Tanacetum coccineum]
MKKVQRLLSINDGDERKHVLDYTHVDLHYVEDQRKNLLSKFNSLNQELSSYKIFDLKKVIEKWTSSKVTLDQLLTEQVPGNIVCALEGRGAWPNETSEDDITLADLTFTSIVSDDIKKVLDKRSAVKGLKKKSQPMTSFVPNLSLAKKADSSTEKLLFTLIEEDCYMKPKCFACGSTDHTTKEYYEQAVVKKTLARLKAQSSQGSSRKAPMIPKPFIDCKYCGFNDHHSDECEYYPGCDICGSIAHETSNCTKKPSSNNRKLRIANKQSTKPIKKWVHKRN